MEAVKLTKRKIDGFKYAGGWDVRWDTVIPGLGVRIYPSEKKTFVFSFRLKGRKRLMSLGRYGPMTLVQARREAGARAQEVRSGIDPLEARKQESVRGKTVQDLIDQFIADYAKGPGFPKRPHKRTWAADEQRLGRNLPASWKSRRPADISPEDVADLYAKIVARTPYEANRVLENLRKMFDLARGWKYLDAKALNPAKSALETGLITKFKEQGRKVWAKPHQMPALAQAIDIEPDIYVRAVLWLYLLIGVRKSELLCAKWADVDFESGELRLPETKSGEQQRVPLGGVALAILQSVPRMEGNPFIFPGAKKGRPRVNIAKSWGRVRGAATVRLWEAYTNDPRVPALVKRLHKKLGRYPTPDECRQATNIELPPGVEEFRIHDLRRSVGSWLTSSGVDLNLVKKAMRHAAISTTLIYAQLSEDATREPLEQHGKRIMKAAGKTGPVEITDGTA